MHNSELDHVIKIVPSVNICQIMIKQNCYKNSQVPSISGYTCSRKPNRSFKFNVHGKLLKNYI